MKFHPKQLDKMLANNRILIDGVLVPKLLNNPLAFGSLININFLLPHTAHFNNNIVLPLVVLETLGFRLYVYFLHFKQYGSIVLYLRF